MNTKSEFKLILLYMNDLFLEMISFMKKILIVCINCLRINKTLLSIVLLFEILDMECMLYIFLELSWKKQKERFRRMKLQHQKEKTCLKTKHYSSRKMTLSKRDISRDMLLMKCYTFKASSTRFIDKFKRSKRWFDKIQKRSWQVWIVGKPTNSYFSTFV